MIRSRLAPCLALTLLLLAPFAGCGKDDTSPVGPGDGAVVEPVPDITARLTPIAGDHFRLDVRFGVSGMTAPIVRRWRIDPVAGAITPWTAMAGESLQLVFRTEAGRYRVLELNAADGRAAPITRFLEFTPVNVLPASRIVVPRPVPPSALQQPGSVETPLSFTVRWNGVDADGIGTTRPAGYVSRLLPLREVDPDSPSSVSVAELVAYLAADRVANPAAWQMHEATDTSRVLAGLAPELTIFAVLARDPAGEEERRFDLLANVLCFRPTAHVRGPRLTLSSSIFSRTKSNPGLDPTIVATVSLRSVDSFTLGWSAEPGTGREIDGFRWAVDIADIADESPRVGPDDLAHWSEWSTSATGATVGPFAAGSGPRLFHVMARDNLGDRTLALVRMDILDHQPTADLLIIDDLYGPRTELAAGQPPGGFIRISTAYPMEAEQDSFYVARGGFADLFRVRSGTPGAISAAGMFADFDADTLDYAFWPEDGIASPFQYRAVVWYTDAASASRNGSKFGSAYPATAIRTINLASRVNTLAQYVQQGGKLWIFGEGMTSAIANGYWSAIGGAPPQPFTAGDDRRQDVLYPGNFLHDFCKLRSELTRSANVQSAIPYLPEFVGPAGERTALRWAGLPRLTLGGYRGADPNPASRVLPPSWVVTRPNPILEGGVAVLDTLYLAQWADSSSPTAYPNALHYHGSEHGEVIWFGFPMHFFKVEQAREVARVAMRVFGIQPAPSARVAIRRR